jgi:hypothetical protein
MCLGAQIQGTTDIPVVQEEVWKDSEVDKLLLDNAMTGDGIDGPLNMVGMHKGPVQPNQFRKIDMECAILLFLEESSNGEA